MGYNTWNAFHGDIDEDVVKSTADLMVELKLKDAGYEYLVMDGEHSAKSEAFLRLLSYVTCPGAKPEQRT